MAASTRVRAETRRSVVAKRVFDTGSGGRITVRIYKPIRIRQTPEEWAGGYSLDGLGKKQRQGRAIGSDSLQAMLLSVEAVQLELEVAGTTFSWLGGEIGASGIPSPIPVAFGLKFAKRMRQLVEREVACHVESERRKRAVRRARAK